MYSQELKRAIIFNILVELYLPFTINGLYFDVGGGIQNFLFFNNVAPLSIS